MHSKKDIIGFIDTIMERVGCTPLTVGNFISIWYDREEETSFVKNAYDEVYRIDELSFIKVSAILNDLKKEFK